MPDAAIPIQIDSTHTVSALLIRPAAARACLVLAHGAGAGMTHPFMVAVAEGLAARGIATLRFQFPYLEAGSKRPDRPPIAHATIRASVETAATVASGLPLFAGGKSFGGRMTSQAQAEAPLPGIRGLVFFGFPLHAAGKPATERARHLMDVHIPMLFLQGTRDALAQPHLIGPAIPPTHATLVMVEQADHSFHVPVRSGLTDALVMTGLLNDTADWIDRILTNK